MSNNIAENSINTIREFMTLHFEKKNTEVSKAFLADNVKIYCPPSWDMLHKTTIKGINQGMDIDSVYEQAFQPTNYQIEALFVAKDNQHLLGRIKING